MCITFWKEKTNKSFLKTLEVISKNETFNESSFNIVNKKTVIKK